jgi:TFIIF-interacting CTD phosphatase-like protein
MTKTNIILDLDQTLISSEYITKFNFKRNGKKMITYQYAIMPSHFIIFARPYLQQFLDFLFKHFNVSVWTAASKEYGLFIIDKFILTKPNRKLDFFFYSYHTKLSIKKEQRLKSISLLWTMFRLRKYNLKNTFIIDDNSDVYDAQPYNTLRIKEFFYEENEENDVELLRIKEKLQKLII